MTIAKLSDYQPLTIERFRTVPQATSRNYALREAHRQAAAEQAQQFVNRLVVGTLSAITADMGTLTAGKIILLSSTHLFAIGIGFGTTSQFLAWYGPRPAGDDLALCTEANGLYYLKTNGSEFLNSAAVAQSTANSALTIANGKNKTFYQTSAPVASGIGDLWFDTDDNFKPYRWDGAAWLLVHDSTPATSGEIADDAVIASKIFAGAVTAAKIATGAVTAVKIDANAIQTSDYAEDGSGNATAGAKLLVGGTNIKIASASSMRIGTKFLDTQWFGQQFSIHAYLSINKTAGTTAYKSRWGFDSTISFVSDGTGINRLRLIYSTLPGTFGLDTTSFSHVVHVSRVPDFILQTVEGAAFAQLANVGWDYTNRRMEFKLIGTDWNGGGQNDQYVDWANPEAGGQHHDWYITITFFSPKGVGGGSTRYVF